TEVVNAVIPLFDAEVDAPMASYLRCKLVKLLLHFQVVGNVDTFDELSYLAVLAAVLRRALQEPPSEWRATLIKQALDTAEMTYSGVKWWQTYIRLAAQADARAFVTDHPENVEEGVRITCESLSKPLLAVAITARRDKSGVQWMQVVSRMVA